jgi:hypothetical protein
MQKYQLRKCWREKNNSHCVEKLKKRRGHPKNNESGRRATNFERAKIWVTKLKVVNLQPRPSNLGK